MIPKIIHQTWKDDKTPPELEYFVNKVKKLNPNWDYKLWTDELMLEFVEKEFHDFLNKYISFPKNIMRADAFRYLVMYKIGGVYLDLDYEILKPFEFGTHKVVLPYNRQIKFGDKGDAIGNCFFASEPGHQFWLDTIENLKNGTNSNLQKTDAYSTLEEETTGPAFLTRIYNQKKYSDIYNPDRVVYHPRTPRNKKEQNKIEDNGVALGIHHCVGSWREKNFLIMYKNVLKRIFYYPLCAMLIKIQ